jgi:AGZA family xanthine/uracil permease-like MFS transporter
MVILVGVILGWATGLNQGSDVKAAAGLVKWWGPVWTASDLFADFGLVADYLGIVIPIGISAAATSLMCLVSAKEAGDPFPVVSFALFVLFERTLQLANHFASNDTARVHDI